MGEECLKKVMHGSLDLGGWARGGKYKEIDTAKSPMTHHLGPFLTLHDDLVLMRKVLRMCCPCHCRDSTKAVEKTVTIEVR